LLGTAIVLLVEPPAQPRTLVEGAVAERDLGPQQTQLTQNR
jgi:hypothetical protein